MKVPEGFEVQLFASGEKFRNWPINSNGLTQRPTSGFVHEQLPSMVTWSSEAGDKLLIFEDTNQDGRADVCKTFYDKLICPLL